MSINKIYLLIFLIWYPMPALPAQARNPFVIMIDPSGDARQSGRLIEDTLERGITLQYAQAVKEMLEKISYANVIITRDAGEIVYPLQNASFANRLNVDLYLSIHACYTPKSKTSIDIFTYGTNDYIPERKADLSMIPLDKAYQTHHDQTQTIAHALKQTCSDYYPHVPVRGIFTLPLTALRGINVPALELELCLASKDDWTVCVEPVAVSIAQYMDQ